MGIEPILSQLSASRVFQFRHICILGVRTPPCYKGFIRFRRYTYKELEQVAGIEPASTAWKAVILAVRRYLHMERIEGIEPSTKPWQGLVLPLNYIRIWCSWPDLNRHGIATTGF